MTPEPAHINGDGRRSTIAVMDAARKAQFSWAALPVRARLDVVRAARYLIVERSGVLTDEITRAGWRVPSEALTTEVLPLADACKFLERRAAKLLAPRRLGPRGRPAWLVGVRAEVRREPCGIVLVLAPSNYPLFLPGVQIIQALTAGNAVVAKPAAGGGPVLSILATILGDAGLPPDLLAILDDTVEAGEEALRGDVDKVIFTGSATNGRRVAAALAERLTPAALELSGNDAVFVLPGADLDLVADAIAYGLRLNGGATCIAPRRVFVGEKAATALEHRLKPQVEHLAPVRVPPAIRDRLGPLVEEAAANNCRFIPEPPDMSTEAMRPLVVLGADPSLGLLKSDVFAPVVSVVAVADAEAALEAAALCPYALGASIFGPEAEARALAGRVKAGSVTINDIIVPTADPRLPFGGRGESGYGVTRGAEGLLEMTRIKTVSVRRGSFRPHLEPIRPGDMALLSAFASLAHGRGWRGRLPHVAALFRAIGDRRKHPDHDDQSKT